MQGAHLSDPEARLPIHRKEVAGWEVGEKGAWVNNSECFNAFSRICSAQRSDYWLSCGIAECDFTFGWDSTQWLQHTKEYIGYIPE